MRGEHVDLTVMLRREPFCALVIVMPVSDGCDIRSQHLQSLYAPIFS